MRHAYRSILRHGLALLLALCAAHALAGTVAPAEGLWRGEFTVNGEALPFNFELAGLEGAQPRLVLLNGSRRDEFEVEKLAGGGIRAVMNTYDAALEATVEEGSGGKRLVGHYRDLVPKRNGANDLPFTAEHGQAWRFVPPERDAGSAANLDGKWAILNRDRSAGPNQVALLRQEGTRLTGVFMTVVGDTRELEGVVQGDRFWLSHFSGPSPVLVRGTIEDGQIQGAISFGIYNVARFEGHRSDEVELPDPYRLTYLKDGRRSIDFSFPDLEGRPASLRDDKYRGKVVIVEVIGTWCPNCTDQTRFLAPWFRENRQRGVEAIAVAFEQEDSFEYFQQRLRKFRDFFDIHYDIVHGGVADKKLATEKLQGLNYMAAFPTTIVIDRRGEVREIYTGFTGPVTGGYYEEYVARFNALMDELLAEPDPYAATAGQ